MILLGMIAYVVTAALFVFSFTVAAGRPMPKPDSANQT